MTVQMEGLVCLVWEGGMNDRVKCSTQKWYGHLEKMGRNEITRRMYKNKADAVHARK